MTLLDKDNTGINHVNRVNGVNGVHRVRRVGGVGGGVNGVGGGLVVYLIGSDPSGQRQHGNKPCQRNA